MFAHTSVQLTFKPAGSQPIGAGVVVNSYRKIESGYSPFFYWEAACPIDVPCADLVDDAIAADREIREEAVEALGEARLEGAVGGLVLGRGVVAIGPGVDGNFPRM